MVDPGQREVEVEVEAETHDCHRIFQPSHSPERGSSSSYSSSSASPEKIPKWSRRAIKSFATAKLEARKLKYPANGTEAHLVGLLIEGTSTASRFLRVNGINLTKVREEALKIIPKGDMYFFSPEHPPLTDHAQRALDWALEQKLKSVDDGEITSRLLLGILSEVESPGPRDIGFTRIRRRQSRGAQVFN